ncbi:hypothetical protein BDV93DRAFT_106476 [Ceratobasidium sp. AG-I]|nr:hypothetical protein BDV93DRAFT_106476 [Ceratobasidium sp. AG-I]
MWISSCRDQNVRGWLHFQLWLWLCVPRGTPHTAFSTAFHHWLSASIQHGQHLISCQPLSRRQTATCLAEILCKPTSGPHLHAHPR